MIRIYDFNTVAPQEILNRDLRAEADVDAQVDDILAQVRRDGDAALRRYAARFDGAQLDGLAVTEEEMDAAMAAVDPNFLETLQKAADNIRSFHEAQVHRNFVQTRADGAVLGQRYTPIERVGVCVPGSPTAFPSTVLMDVIPARIAGVREIVLVTPPDRNGAIAQPALAAARIAGATKIFKIGGAQGVAALAYGTRSVPRVDKIVGPGGIYVATAKRKVFGQVAIDMGWNRLELKAPDDPIFRYFRDGEYVYYVHSYYAVNCAGSTLAVSRYGNVDVTGVVRRGNVWGTQFHPEKSGDAGLRLLRAFSEL